MSGWQDIETAPKNGDDFIIYGPFLGTLIVSFDEGAIDPDFPWLAPDGPHYFHGSFSHWMPLPDPPLSTGGSVMTETKDG